MIEGSIFLVRKKLCSGVMILNAEKNISLTLKSIRRELKMVWMQRKIKCKVINPDYKPDGIPDKFIPVLGIETRKREKEYQGKKMIVEDVYYLVVDNRGKLLSIASFNCATMVDEEAELKLNRATELLNNVTVMWRVANEKLQEVSGTGSNKADEKEGG